MISMTEMNTHIRKFFGYIMIILGERGFSREEKKRLIRGSGLIEKCKTYDGATYVLHTNVETWCDYMMNGNRKPDYSIPNRFDRYYQCSH